MLDFGFLTCNWVIAYVTAIMMIKLLLEHCFCNERENVSFFRQNSCLEALIATVMLYSKVTEFCMFSLKYYGKFFQ